MALNMHETHRVRLRQRHSAPPAGNWFIVGHSDVPNETPQTPAGTSTEMDKALLHMRQAESAHFDAAMAIRDAETLRLYALKQDIEPLLQGHAEITDFLAPALYTGTPPRLWIDLTSYVVMQPDPRTYRLVQDTRDGHHTLAETADRDQMVRNLRDFIAHRTITRQRELSAAPHPTNPPPAGHSTAALILAWLAGFSLGVLGLLVVAAVWTRAA